MILDTNAIDFIEVLSSAAPAPGGGGASATVGALAAAMGLMVANLTTGKKKYAEAEEEIQEAIIALTTYRDRLIHLVDEDADGFLPLSRAYGMPKSTPEEIAKKEVVMEEALMMAIKAPEEIMEVILQVMSYLKFLGEKGSVLAVSDAGVGILFAESAVKAASLNVFINTKMLKNKEQALLLNQKAEAMIREAEILKEDVYGNVLGKLKG